MLPTQHDDDGTQLGTRSGRDATMNLFQRSTMLTTAFLICSAFVQAERVNWSPDVETALRSANQSGRLVLMKFTADWCGYCKKMERETFTRPNVARAVNEQFVPVLVDADKHQNLVKSLNIKGLPALLVVSPEMVILSRITGYQTEEKLMPKLQTVLAQHSRTQTPNTSVVTAPTPSHTPAQTPVQAPTRTASTAQTAPPVRTVAQPSVQSAAPVAAPAFGGLCLSGVSETRSLVSGRPDFTTVHRGKLLYFSSEQQRQNFLQKPEKYWPANDGACPVTQFETGRKVEGKLEFGAVFRGQLWTTASVEAMHAFVKSPARFVDGLSQK